MCIQMKMAAENLYTQALSYVQPRVLFLTAPRRGVEKGVFIFHCGKGDETHVLYKQSFSMDTRSEGRGLLSWVRGHKGVKPLGDLQLVQAAALGCPSIRQKQTQQLFLGPAVSLICHLCF